jgi:hypothetical protein
MGDPVENAQTSLLNIGAVNVPKTWEKLFSCALILIDEIALHGRPDPFWTFGGGTVLMLRYAHRHSKDVDIFVPDPQSLGFVTPRLSSVAEGLTADYSETTEYVKLFMPEGEIDFVASPNLTSPGFEIHTIMGRPVRVETSVEIIAKKLWHRGHKITGRDIFDFALVAEKEPESLMQNAHFMVRYAREILLQLTDRYDPLRTQFEAVEAISFHPTFDSACDTLRKSLTAMLAHLQK